MANLAGKQGSDSYIQPDRASYTSMEIPFSRTFETSEASDKFYGKIFIRLMNSHVNVFITSDEEIIFRDKIIFKLSFTIAFKADIHSGNHNAIYIDTAKRIINEEHNKYGYKNYRTDKNQETYSQESENTSVTSIFSKIFNPYSAMIIPVLMVAIFGVYSFANHEDGKNTNPSSSPSPTTTPKSVNQ